MIQEPLIFLGILIVSLIISNFFLNDRAGPFKPIAMRLFFIGVIFHELSHALVSIVVGRIPDHFKIKWRDEKSGSERSPHGSINFDKPPSFLQAAIIAIGPLIISTWLIFLLFFQVVLNSIFNPIIKTIAVFLCLSLLITASPSTGDLRYISYSFRNAPAYSCYQIFLIGFSILIFWLFLIITHITFFLDFFYYIVIAGIYLSLKYSLIGIRKLIIKIQSRDFTKPSKVRFKRFSRKHYKPKKPWKEK
ncbi:MAG: hypothetical protein ACFFDN_13265 [Candidatus Hodarchaeota archaeon]